MSMGGNSDIVQAVMGKWLWGSLPMCYPAKLGVLAQGDPVNRANESRFSPYALQLGTAISFPTTCPSTELAGEATTHNLSVPAANT